MLLFLLCTCLNENIRTHGWSEAWALTRNEGRLECPIKTWNATAVYWSLETVLFCLFCGWGLPEGLEFQQMQMSEYSVACLANLSTEILVTAGTMELAMTSLSVLPVELWYLVFSSFPMDSIGCGCRKWHWRPSSRSGLEKRKSFIHHTGTATNREQDGLGNALKKPSIRGKWKEGA